MFGPVTLQFGNFSAELTIYPTKSHLFQSNIQTHTQSNYHIFQWLNTQQNINATQFFSRHFEMQNDLYFKNKYYTHAHKHTKR